jgi:5-methylcytosine-specific restriction endonuclease McrA
MTGRCSRVPVSRLIALDDGVASKAELKRYRHRVYERDGYACIACGWESPPPREGLLTLDHWIPESRGGATDMGNLVTMCGPCNAEKDCLLPEEWLAVTVRARRLTTGGNRDGGESG